MRFWIESGNVGNVALEIRVVLTQVVPQANQISPVATFEWGRKAACALGNVAQVIRNIVNSIRTIALWAGMRNVLRVSFEPRHGPPPF